MRGDVVMSAFTGEPQPIDIHHRGLWYRGELLGWRFDGDRCLARVRCVVDGLRHSTWKDLAELRLPEPETASGPAPVTNPPVVAAARAARPSVSPARQARMDDDTRPHELLPHRDGRGRPSAGRPPVPVPSRPARRRQISPA